MLSYRQLHAIGINASNIPKEATGVRLKEGESATETYSNAIGCVKIAFRGQKVVPAVKSFGCGRKSGRPAAAPPDHPNAGMPEKFWPNFANRSRVNTCVG